MAGVAPDWCRRKWTYVDSHHRWLHAGRIIKWQQQWKSDFEADRISGKWPPPEKATQKIGAAAKRALWQIEKEIEIVDAAIEAHPRRNRAMGQTFTPEQESEYDALRKKLKTLQAEKNAAMQQEAAA